MLNGYLPIVGSNYLENVFRPLKAMNSGVLDAPRIRRLQELGVRYILCHENAFPEKVSPFAVAFTLEKFLSHPRLKLLGRAGPVWAFALQDRPEAAPGKGPLPPQCVACPARHFTASGVNPRSPLPRVRNGDLTFVGLRPGGPLWRLRRFSAPPAPDLRWMILARGRGVLRVQTTFGSGRVSEELVSVDCGIPAWFAVPLSLPDYERVGLELTGVRGRVEVAHVFLAAGRWDELAPGEEIVLPAFCLFHAGNTASDLAAVEFDPQRDPRAIVLYGPKLPVPPGIYRVRLEYESPAAPGTLIGRINVRHVGGGQSHWTDVVAGSPAAMEFGEVSGVPFYVAFLYERGAPVTVHGIRLRRLR